MRITDQGELTALSKLLTNCKAALAKTATAKTELNFTMADLVEATYPGYNRKSPITWGSPATDGAGYGFTNCTQIVWTAGTIVTPETMYWFLLILDWNASDLVLAAHQFATPIVVNTTGQEIKIDVQTLCSKFDP